MYRNLANIITLTRILFSMLLLFTAAFSWDFYLCYLICGISDILDGSVARYFHSESEFGSRLDSLADFIFFAISCFKILPNIKITCVFMIWAGLIFIIRLICIGINYRKDRSDYMLLAFLCHHLGGALYSPVVALTAATCKINFVILAAECLCNLVPCLVYGYCGISSECVN